MAYLSKYGVARKIRIPMVKRGVVDHAVGADWTPAAGDVKISKDGGAAANVTNLPTAIAMGNSTIWEFSLTATEMQAAQINVTVADSATKAVEDTAFDIETYGNASGQHAVDLSDSVRAGLTALPNAAAEAAGGLYTRGSGAGQINQNANGQIDSRWVAGNVTVGTNNDKTGYSLTQTFPANFSSLAITAGGAVTAGTVSDKTGYALTAAYDFAKGTSAMMEAYAANGVAPTPVQALFAIHQMLMQFAISGTSYTAKKLDNATTAFVVTLNDATNPTSAVRT